MSIASLWFPFGGGWVEASPQLAAAQLRVTRSSLAALNGQPIFGGGTKLYAPRFSTGGSYASHLNVVNPSTSSAALRLRAINDSGIDLVQPISVALGAGRQWRTNIAQLFGLNASTETTGSIIVESSARVIGALSLHDSAGRDKFRSAFALETNPARHTVFAHLESGPNRFTEVSVLNPNTTPAHVTVSVFHTNGVLKGAATLVLSAGGRTTRNLAELVSASAGLSGGSFVVESSQPIFASALAGEDSLNTLTAVPAHTAAAVAPPVTTGSLKADYEFQNTLASSVGSAPALTHFGEGHAFVSETVNGTTRTVLRFPQGNGLVLSNFSTVVPSHTWSIAVQFRFDNGNGYRRLLDLKNGTSDLGCYVRQGALFFVLFNSVGATATIEPNSYAQVAITRAADGTVTGYQNGALAVSFKDDGAVMLSNAADALRFFRDNNSEESAGAVARIRLFNAALTPQEVLVLEPVVQPPRLDALLSATQLVLSWPATATGFSLQSTASLSPPINWTPVTSPITPSGARNTVTVSLGNSSQFYRLARS